MTAVPVTGTANSPKSAKALRLPTQKSAAGEGSLLWHNPTPASRLAGEVPNASLDASRRNMMHERMKHNAGINPSPARTTPTYLSPARSDTKTRRNSKFKVEKKPTTRTPPIARQAALHALVARLLTGCRVRGGGGAFAPPEGEAGDRGGGWGRE
ncbi:hypothetical protein B0H13DRAFT_2374373 [Mycena leptocephala]|nr:hypothetical protein B0H13DRAFT_2374373 [Mycena leptocephala]